MTRLAKLLKNRVSVLKPVKVPNDAGGFDRGYERVSQVWSQLKPIAQASRDISHFAAYIRGTQVSSVATHKMKVRRIAVIDIGSQFNPGFNRGFAVAGSLQILKSEYYIFEGRGDTDGAFAAGFNIGYNQTEGLIGSLYRILSGVDNESDHEYLEIRLMEVEEQGTGASE
jgi:hypothetical protein